MVLNDAGGWLNGDVAAGWPAVVALGVAEGVGVVAGGGGVVTLAGAAGLAVRACDRGGAVTVTVGTVRVGAVCDAAGGASGVGCGAGAAGVSDAGGLLVGGDSGAGVCDEATPVKQSSMSAELLRRCKRLLRILMTAPKFPTGTPRPPRDRRITAKRRRAGCRAAVAGATACRHRIDVRLGEVRVPRTARVAGRGNQRRVAARLACGRKCPAAATRAARQGPRRRQDGSGYRSDSGRPLDRAGPWDSRA